MQVLRSMEDGANHLGGDETTTGVDPDREFFPAGQGVGAIDELVPAGELVHRFVEEAERLAARPSDRGRTDPSPEPSAPPDRSEQAATGSRSEPVSDHPRHRNRSGARDHPTQSITSAGSRSSSWPPTPAPR